MSEAARPKGRRSSQPVWQRVVLLAVLVYEALGALVGGGFLVAAPDGSTLKTSVAVLHGTFRDFRLPGLILSALGVLSLAAFVAVLRRSRADWFVAGLALGGFAVWFLVEIAIVREVVWLHAVWGLPVVAGIFATIPLAPQISR